MLKRLTLATGNADKVKEIDQFFRDFGKPIDVKKITDIDPSFDPEECGSSFKENAEIKARAAYELCKSAVLADDSGLVVEALKGAPGIYSARYAGPDATYKSNNEKLLAELAGVPREKRKAYFICHMTLITEEGETIHAEGRLNGMIADKAQGEEGFGYDPVVLLPDRGVTVAELSPKTKNEISHRANALKLMVKTLEERGLLIS